VTRDVVVWLSGNIVGRIDQSINQSIQSNPINQSMFITPKKAAVEYKNKIL